MPRNSKFWRFIFNTLTVVSLLLLLATVGLWGMSHRQEFTILYCDEDDDGRRWAQTIMMILIVDGSVHLEHWATSGGPQQKKWSAFEPGFTVLGTYDAYILMQLDTLFMFDNTPATTVERLVSCPILIFAVVFAIGPAIWLFKWNRRRNLGPNACLSCGYDLTGNETGECPECGKSTGTEAAQT